MVRRLISYGFERGVLREIAFDFVPSISLLITILAAGAWLLGISFDGAITSADRNLLIDLI